MFSSCANKEGSLCLVLNLSVIIRSNGNATWVSLGYLLSLSLFDRLMVSLSLFERELEAWDLLGSSDPQPFPPRNLLTSLYLSKCQIYEARMVVWSRGKLAIKIFCCFRKGGRRQKWQLFRYLCIILFLYSSTNSSPIPQPPAPGNPLSTLLLWFSLF